MRKFFNLLVLAVVVIAGFTVVYSVFDKGVWAQSSENGRVEAPELQVGEWWTVKRETGGEKRIVTRVEKDLVYLDVNGAERIITKELN